MISDYDEEVLKICNTFKLKLIGRYFSYSISIIKLATNFYIANLTKILMITAMSNQGPDCPKNDSDFKTSGMRHVSASILQANTRRFTSNAIKTTKYNMYSSYYLYLYSHV
jgi:hypothetical protein